MKAHLQAKANNFVYIFGYGSLMQTRARRQTLDDPENALYLPVKIKHFARQWNVWSNRQRVLGIEPGDSHDMSANGLLFAVQRDRLSAFDQREGAAYKRIRVPIENLHFYHHEHRKQLFALGQQPEIFVYSPDKTSRLYAEKGDQQKKIARSYLSVVCVGSVEIDRYHNLNGLFIRDCFQTLGIEGYRIEDDAYQLKYLRHPEALLNEAIAAGNQSLVKELKRFIEKEWQSDITIINARCLLDSDHKKNVGYCF